MRFPIWFLLAASAGIAHAQSDVNCPTVNFPKTIRGMVRLNTNAAAPMGILVRVKDRTLVEVARTQTDDRGKFEFDNLPANVYTVEINERGYKSVEERYELICANNAYANITLRIDPRNPPNIPPEGPASTFAANAPQKPENLKELDAGQAVLTQDPKSAAAHFETVTKSEPEYVPAYLLLATARILCSEFDSAVQAVDVALKMKPESSQAHMLRGMALGMKNDLAGAQKSLKKSLELNPSSYDAQLELGKVFLASGQNKDAQGALKKAAELSPNEPFPHVLLGNAMLAQHDAKGALQQFREAVRLAPQSPMAPVLRHKIETLEKGEDAKPEAGKNK